MFDRGAVSADPVLRQDSDIFRSPPRSRRVAPLLPIAHRQVTIRHRRVAVGSASVGLLSHAIDFAGRCC